MRKSYYIDWHSIAVGAIELRSIQDNITDISFAKVRDDAAFIEELPILEKWQYGTKEEVEEISSLAERISGLLRSSSLPFDSSLGNDLKYRIGVLRNLLLPIRTNAFRQYIEVYFDRLTQDFCLPSQTNPESSTSSISASSTSEKPQYSYPLQFTESGRKADKKNIIAWEILEKGGHSTEAEREAYRIWLDYDDHTTPEKANKFQWRNFKSAMRRAKLRAQKDMK